MDKETYFYHHFQFGAAGLTEEKKDRKKQKLEYFMKYMVLRMSQLLHISYCRLRPLKLNIFSFFL